MRNLLSILFLLFNSIGFSQIKFQHISSSLNISNNSTYLNTEGLNGNPNAIIIVEYGAATKNANPHAVGVWYDGSKWAIFNQDRVAMIEGLTFSITWKNADVNSFSQKASANSINNGKLILNHPSLNSNPSASFYASQVWNPGGFGGIYNNADITVEYNNQLARWQVKNMNGAALPEGAAVNVLIVTNSNAANATINPGIINNLPAANNNNPIVVINDLGAVKNATPVNNSPVNNIDPTILAAAQTFTNTDFEFGLSKWTATGTAFSNQPVQGNTVASERVLVKMKYDDGGIGGDYWKGIAYPIGIKNDFWIGTYEKGNGDAPTGTLISSPIKITNRYLHFLLGGGNDFNKIYVELQVKKTDYEAAWGAGKRSVWGETADGFARVSRVTSLLNTEELYRYWFDLDAELNHQFANKTIRIEIIDNSSRSWGHINTDDFQQSDFLTDFISINKEGFSLYADKDKPVFGFADTHAHWMNHIGLNGLMHGNPGSNLENSNVLTDIPPCDGFNHNLPTITPSLLIAQLEKSAFNRMGERMADPGNLACATFAIPSAIASLPISATAAIAGAMDVALGNFLITAMGNPAFQACGHQFTKDVFAKHYSNTIPNTTAGNFIDFPRWNSFFHQMMHISWVKRSYEGGQRMMVVPVGVAKSWEFNISNDGVMGLAKQKVEEAVAALKHIVSQNPNWLEIAYTPADARRIILTNKMAIVIALEQAEVGNYFDDVNQEINWLYNLGIRHVFPIHNINNKLGGAAVFNSALVSYNDLVNRASPQSPIQSFRIRTGYTNQTLADKSFTKFKFKNSFMRQGMRTIPIAGFGTIPFFYLNDVPAEYQYEDDVFGTPSRIFIGHKNADGLYDKGRSYINELMKKGLIIDVDHMSDLSQDEAMRMMSEKNYPMISGHTNFRELRAANNHSTSDEAKMRTEFTIHDNRAAEINNAGGMFGLMTQQADLENAKDCPVKNLSPGGTPTFSQAYWYAFQKTKGEKGIAFGTDFNGFAPQTAPRFGVDAAATIEGDEYRNQSEWGKDKEINRRRAFAFVQKNGVRYDSPINTWHYHRFLKPSFLYSEEREIWEAIAMAKSGTDINTAWQPGGGISVERTWLQQNKIKNLATGFKLTSQQYAELDCPEYGIAKGDCPPERKAAYMCVNGEGSVQQNWKDGRTMELYRIVKPIYNLWMQFENGPNEPLRRSYAYSGGRDFDFNLDGLAHYGMLPDLIQDMKNTGFSSEHLRPLFLSSEQYIKMWEQADAAKNSIRN